jgi:hypothetical protein
VALSSGSEIIGTLVGVVSEAKRDIGPIEIAIEIAIGIDPTSEYAMGSSTPTVSQKAYC